MTDAPEDIRTWEVRPRCLVVVPGLSFEEFAEGPWASVKGTHESSNWWMGDALVYLDQFEGQGSQLLDESLTPARMAQLKWLAEAIPPARRRDDCSWTVHREVAALFARRRGIFPAAYLDRKTEHQDALLARAGAERWTSDRMKAEVKALEQEALNSITRRNEPPEDEERDPEPAEAVDLARVPDDPKAIGDSDGRSRENRAGETEAGQTIGCGSDARLCPVDEPQAETPPGTDNPVSHGEIGGNPVATTGDFAVVAAPDRAELRACIDAVRAAPAAPLADEARIAAALGKPGLDLGNTDRVLTAFTPGWRLKIEQQVDDAGKSRWSVMAMKAGAQRAMGINKNGGGSWFNIAHNTVSGKGRNPDGRKQHGSGAAWWDKAPDDRRKEATAIKNGGDWFGSGDNCSAQRRHQSGSTSRKFASAMIAKIPQPLARHIAVTFLPNSEERGAA